MSILVHLSASKRDVPLRPVRLAFLCIIVHLCASTRIQMHVQLVHSDAPASLGQHDAEIDCHISVHICASKCIQSRVALMRQNAQICTSGASRSKRQVERHCIERIWKMHKCT